MQKSGLRLTVCESIGQCNVMLYLLWEVYLSTLNYTAWGSNFRCRVTAPPLTVVTQISNGVTSLSVALPAGDMCVVQ